MSLRSFTQRFIGVVLFVRVSIDLAHYCGVAPPWLASVATLTQFVVDHQRPLWLVLGLMERCLGRLRAWRLIPDRRKGNAAPH